MKSVSSEIVRNGFKKANGDYFSKIIPNDFRGVYTLYISNNDIGGVFQGMATQEHNLPSFINKLSFRTPEAAQSVIDLLESLKKDGIIDYDEIKNPPADTSG